MAASTLLDYRAVGKRLVKHLGAHHLPQFEQSEIMDYVKLRREDGAGARLITRELKLLATFLKGTVGISYLTWSIPRLVDATENATKPIPSDEEIAAVYGALDSRPDVQRAFLLGLLTALRASDVCSLESTDKVNGVITVGMRKRRGTPIAVPVVDTLKDALKGVEGKLTPTVGRSASSELGVSAREWQMVLCASRITWDTISTRKWRACGARRKGDTNSSESGQQFEGKRTAIRAKGDTFA